MVKKSTKLIENVDADYWLGCIDAQITRIIFLKLHFIHTDPQRSRNDKVLQIVQGQVYSVKIYVVTFIGTANQGNLNED